MLTVTRDGHITGNYWEGIRRIEKERAKETLERAEQRQRDNYRNAVEAAARWKPAEEKTIKKPNRKGAGRPTYAELYGETISDLHFYGNYTNAQIANKLGISMTSVKNILSMLLAGDEEVI